MNETSPIRGAPNVTSIALSWRSLSPLHQERYMANAIAAIAPPKLWPVNMTRSHELSDASRRYGSSPAISGLCLKTSSHTPDSVVTKTNARAKAIHAAVATDPVASHRSKGTTRKSATYRFRRPTPIRCEGSVFPSIGSVPYHNQLKARKNP